METLMIKIKPEKKAFFLSLLQEFSFVEIDDNSFSDEEIRYINAIVESERDIEENRIFSHEEIIKQVQGWHKKAI